MRSNKLCSKPHWHLVVKHGSAAGTETPCTLPTTVQHATDKHTCHRQTHMHGAQMAWGMIGSTSIRRTSCSCLSHTYIRTTPNTDTATTFTNTIRTLNVVHEQEKLVHLIGRTETLQWLAASFWRAGHVFGLDVIVTSILFFFLISCCCHGNGCPCQLREGENMPSGKRQGTGRRGGREGLHNNKVII